MADSKIEDIDQTENDIDKSDTILEDHHEDDQDNLIKDDFSGNIEDSDTSEQIPNQAPVELESNKTNPKKVNIEIGEIPEYALKSETFERHKMLEEALLTQELIKLFDVICKDITLKEKNYFSLYEYMLKVSNSTAQSETLKKNFKNLVDLLSTKTVLLIKVVETDREGNPFAISLLPKKRFNLFLLNKFNDYLLINYSLENANRRPILFNLDQISESLKIERKEINNFCIFYDLLTLNTTSLQNINRGPDTGKVALVINLTDEHFGEAVIPLYLAPNLLEYLTNQIKDFIDDIKNEKVAGILRNKMEENKIGMSSIKKNLLKPDPYNTNLAVFLRFFNNIMTQIYNKNYNLSNTKIKEIEEFIVISMVVNSLILNTKVHDKEESDVDWNENYDDLVLKNLISYVRELGNELVQVPISLKALVLKIDEDCRNKKLPLIDSNKVISVFQKLNKNNHTIKDISIIRVEDVNYYLHRAALLPLFLAIFKNERKSLENIISQSLQEKSSQILRSKEIFNDFLEENISIFFLSIHKCTITCLMMYKPESFRGNQTQYWLNRFFLTPDEINHLKLNNSNLDINERNKRQKLKEVLTITMNSNNDFKEIPEILQINYENYKLKLRTNIFDLFINGINKLMQIFISLTIKDNFNSEKGNSKKSKFDYVPANNTEVSLKKVLNKKNKPNATGHLKKLEDKFPILEDKKKLIAKINAEHDNWNLKIGDKQDDSKSVIDGIINTCVDRFDAKNLLDDDFDVLYNMLLRNNPFLTKIKNQTALKNYMLYKIILAKYEQIKRQVGMKE